MTDLDYSRRNKVPRPLSEAEKERLEEFVDSIHYSARYALSSIPALEDAGQVRTHAAPQFAHG